MYAWRALCQVQFLILLVVFIFLGLTPTPEKDIPMFNDKLMHISGYIVAALSISFAYPLRTFAARGIFLALFSIGIEIGQHFMPPRTFDVYDIAANCTGVSLGLSIIYLLQTYLTAFRRLLFAGLSQPGKAL